VDQTFDPILENGNVEVDQETNWPTSKTQIGQELSLVDRSQAFHGLEFHHDKLLDQQIEPVTAIELLPFVLDGQRNFFAE